MGRAVIEYHGLCKRYSVGGSEIPALDSVSFNVNEGDFGVVVGPSGCGKSTLLKITAGLVGKTSGSVLVNGGEVVEPTPDIGFVFQNPVLLNWRKVLENVLLPIEILERNVEDYRSKAEELIHLVGLDGFDDKYPFQLSGGMQMRVSLARALIHEPSILLMDEPFSSLDALTREAMALELLNVWEEKRPTVLLVTHDIAEAVFLAHYVVVLTKRPAKVDSIIPIDIARPRTLRDRYSTKALEYVTMIHSKITGN